jgi:uncharacterized protein YjeT (DUF2065 family)
MSDIVAALGLVLVIEGVLYALFPGAMRRMGERVVNTPGDTMRLAGLVSAAIGVALVWLVRG